MDHVGGLINLVYKLTTKSNNRNVNLFIPNMETWDGVLEMLKARNETYPWEEGV
jgi:hypothetical protein